MSARPRARLTLTAAILAAALCSIDGAASDDSSPRFHHPLERLGNASGLPPIVYASCTLPHSSDGLRPVPGFGLLGRTLASPGRLRVLRGGKATDFIVAENMRGLSDPCVSWDGRMIVFAADLQTDHDPRWRLWLVGVDGRGLRQIPLSGAPDSSRGPSWFDLVGHDDFDPVWLPDGRIIYSTTIATSATQHGLEPVSGARIPVSNLFVVRADGSSPERITTERNGGEEAAVDPSTGKVLYARWFFNPYLPANNATGLTEDRAQAMPIDDVDQWQVVSILPDGDRIQLAAGDPRDRMKTSGYQPAVSPKGEIVSVRTEPASPVAVPKKYFLVLSPHGVGEERVLDVRGPDGEVLDVVSPAWLDERHLIASARSSPGEPFALITIDTRTSVAKFVAAEEGRDLLDACPIIKRRVPPILPAQGGIDDPAPLEPVTTIEQVRRRDDTFRFDCLNVFATGPVDGPWPAAPALTRRARIRFFATLSRPQAATGDTVVLVREAALDATGGVHQEDIPGDVPLFEQLVGPDGGILRSPRGPAHVPGSNFSRVGSGTKCVGCHIGHSAIPVPKNYADAAWFNAAPSAEVSVSSRDGKGAPENLVDLRARGDVDSTGWVAGAAEGQWARLAWREPVEAKTVVLYAPWANRATHTDVRIGSCDVILFRDGHEVGRVRAAKSLRPEGTRIEFPPTRLDAIEIRPGDVRGLVRGRPTAALAEVEVIARLFE